MALLHLLLDLAIPPAAIIGLFLIMPAVIFAESVYWFVHLFKREHLRGKVVVITGASSGIGEHVAYQYARRGSRLVLAARRESKLNETAGRAKSMGATDTMVFRADVRKEEDCRNLIEATVTRFGQLDHLVLNAGVANSFLFEEAKNTKGFRVVMDTIFWGSVYPTYYALPYLRQSKGRLVVNASVAAWLTYPRQTLYNAAKTAQLQFFDTLRTEVKGTVGITIAMPGWVESEMTQGKFISDSGDATFKQQQRDVHIGPFPVLPTEVCAEAIVSGVERKMRYVVVPFWYISFLPCRLLVPGILEWTYALFFLPRGNKPPLNNYIVDKNHVTKVLYPPSLEEKKD